MVAGYLTRKGKPLRVEIGPKGKLALLGGSLQWAH